MPAFNLDALPSEHVRSADFKDGFWRMVTGVGGAAAVGALRWLLLRHAPAPIGGDEAVLATLIRAQREAE